jgi:hypothetical protein
MLYEGTDTEETEEGSTMDNIQMGLDGIGLIPGIGEFADGLNGIISLGRGDVTGAGLSFISMVPGIGDAIGKGGKVARAAMKSPVIKKVAKAGADKAPALAKKSKKAAEQIKTAGEKMEKVKNVVTKKAGDVKKLHKSVLDADLGALEKQFGKKIPDKYRAAAEQALKMAGEKMKDVDMKDVMDKIDTVASAGEEVDETGAVEESLKYDLFYQTTSRNDANKIWSELADCLHEQRMTAKKK